MRSSRRRMESRVLIAVEALKVRALMANGSLFFPSASLYPSEDLRQPPVIPSRGGTLDATLNMVRAGFVSDPILYGGKPIFSSPPAPNPQSDPPRSTRWRTRSTPTASRCPRSSPGRSSSSSRARR